MDWCGGLKLALVPMQGNGFSWRLCVVEQLLPTSVAVMRPRGRTTTNASRGLRLDEVASYGTASILFSITLFFSKNKKF